METHCLQIFRYDPIDPTQMALKVKPGGSISLPSYKELPSPLRDTILPLSTVQLSYRVWSGSFGCDSFRATPWAHPILSTQKDLAAITGPANRKAGNSWMKHANPAFPIAVKGLNMLSFFISFIAHRIRGKFGGK